MPAVQPVQGLPKQVYSPEERQDLETRVLHPETDTKRVQLGPHAVELRPLTLRQEKMLGSKCIEAMKKIAQAQDGKGDLSFLDDVANALVQAVVYLAQIYRLEGVTVEWLLDQPTSGEGAVDIEAFIQAQLDHGRQNVFTLVPLVNCFIATRGILAGTQQAVESIATLAKALSRPSATPGGAPGTSSSVGTHGASSSISPQ